MRAHDISEEDKFLALKMQTRNHYSSYFEKSFLFLDSIKLYGRGNIY